MTQLSQRLQAAAGQIRQDRRTACQLGASGAEANDWPQPLLARRGAVLGSLSAKVSAAAAAAAAAAAVAAAAATAAAATATTIFTTTATIFTTTVIIIIMRRSSSGFTFRKNSLQN